MLATPEVCSLSEDADEGEGEEELQHAEQLLHHVLQPLSGSLKVPRELPNLQISFQHRLLLLLLHTATQEKECTNRPQGST